MPIVSTATKRPKKAATAKRPQPAWLQRPMPANDPPPAPERLSAAPRLLSKAEILAITGVSFPTVWTWMRQNAFPRSRVAGGKSVWLSSEIDAWLTALPKRRLKGDEGAA
jgi:predicted DNA-binding transcriptional regulator AlpA